jgi:CheY-like chemotaxis protein
MTASAMQGDRDKCIQAGMNDFVAKPVMKKELARILARWLSLTIV